MQKSTVGGAILSVVNFVKMLKDGFSWLNEILMVIGVALTTVGAILLGVATLPAVIAGAVVAAVATNVCSYAFTTWVPTILVSKGISLSSSLLTSSLMMLGAPFGCLIGQNN